MTKEFSRSLGGVLEMKITVAIPCYNESITIAKVIRDFKHELPEARIIVLDNLSTDRSGELAKNAGAEVFPVCVQGKGNVVRTLFRDFDSDVYILVDGDDTYPATVVHSLLKPICTHKADMVVGDRLSNGTYANENKRRFHNFGNALVCKLVNFSFHSNLHDIMSGYRAFSSRFARCVPVLSSGFEVETEMTISCLDRRLPIIEIPIDYRDRPAGSFSKLNTIQDGCRVLRTIMRILRDFRPLFFFGVLSAGAFLLSILSGLPVVLEFLRTGWVSHVPLAILATGLMIVSGLLLTCALILNTLVMHERQRNEMEILHYRRY